MSESEAHPAPASWVVNTTDETFEQDVLERSHQQLVIVDFWAQWCQPCRMLGPVLEKLASEFQGQFVLVKADTDNNQRAAMQFGVQSIPAVFAILNGQPVDFFAGALPEPQLRVWLNQLLLAQSLEVAQQIETSDPSRARRLYETALAERADCAEAQIGLARLALADGQTERASDIIARLEERGFLEPEAEKIKASLELHHQPPSDLAQLKRLAAQDPANMQAQLDLAKGLAASDQYQPALETALAIVQQDRHGLGEPARQLMVDIFHVLPEGSDLAAEFRRKLSMALY